MTFASKLKPQNLRMRSSKLYNNPSKNSLTLPFRQTTHPPYLPTLKWIIWIEPFLTSMLPSLSPLKWYFSWLSQRNDKGNIYCSIISAQNISSFDFMDKAPSSLMNLDYGLFSKACDHERTAEIGWLLYSTHQQDKERILEMISKLVQESVRAKWYPKMVPY